MLNNLFAYLTVAFMNVKEREEGQGLVEYALILVLVSIVAIVTLDPLGNAVAGVFSDVTAVLP
jgi:pilus assembly protein Flp/PilA